MSVAGFVATGVRKIIFWIQVSEIQTQLVANKEQLSLFSCCRRGRSEQGGMRMEDGSSSFSLLGRNTKRAESLDVPL